jgi:hypothetical protein
MTYTARFSEQWELLDCTYGDAVAGTTETNSGYVSLANFQRVVIIIHPVDVNDVFDVDIEEALTTAGGSPQALAAGGHDISIALADTKPSVIEFTTDELDIADSYDCINVELTTDSTNNNGNDFVIEIWGMPNYLPAVTTNLDSVTD